MGLSRRSRVRWSYGYRMSFSRWSGVSRSYGYRMSLSRWSGVRRSCGCRMSLGRWSGVSRNRRGSGRLRLGRWRFESYGRGVFFRRQRFGVSQGFRVSAIVFGIQGLVGLGRSDVLDLVGGGGYVLIMRSNQFLRSGGMLNAAGASAIGNVVIVDDCGLVDDGGVDVGVADDGLVHVHDRGVIGKFVSAPFAAGKADAHVAEAIIHAAVVADVGTPVALVKSVLAALPAPVSGRPQRTLIGRGHPGSGNPEVSVVAPAPIAGSPHQVGLRAGWLFIDRQDRRRDPDTDADGDLRERRDRNHRYEQSKQKQTCRAKQSHRKNLPVLACLRRGGTRPRAERRRGYWIKIPRALAPFWSKSLRATLLCPMLCSA
jgi:hypothetical protein